MKQVKISSMFMKTPKLIAGPQGSILTLTLFSLTLISVQIQAEISLALNSIGGINGSFHGMRADQPRQGTYLYLGEQKKEK